MRRLCLILFAACSAMTPAGADVVARDVRIMIGPERSVVRELREIAFAAQVQDVVLEGIPASADLDTLQVGGDRQGVKLLGWQRLRTPAPAVTNAVWRPGQSLRPLPDPNAGGGVQCRLEAATLRTRWVEVVYQVEGLAWRADYEINIRGDIANHLEPLSLDLTARVVLSNQTGRAYDEARILLVGQGDFDSQRGQDPGLLMLDDWSPLADRWRPPPPAENLPHAYALDDPVNLPAQGQVAVRLVSTQRQSAERLYSLQNENAFTLDAGVWHPLTRLLVLPNDVAHGLGRALPPGEALIYLGGARGGPYQKAWLPHTERNREVRVSLGTSRGVTASRRAEPREPGTAGLPEQAVTLQLANALPTAVKVEVVERPPVPLAWDLVRSSKPCDRREQNLFFNLEMPARSDTEITYSVRLAEPEP